MFHQYAYKDILEPMTYIYNKYCHDKGRKAVAVGWSMGADMLANLIGYEGLDFLPLRYMLDTNGDKKVVHYRIIQASVGWSVQLSDGK